MMPSRRTVRKLRTRLRALETDVARLVYELAHHRHAAGGIVVPLPVLLTRADTVPLDDLSPEEWAAWFREQEEEA